MSLKSALKRIFLEDFLVGRKTDSNESATSNQFTASKIQSHPLMVHGTISIHEGKIIVTDPKNDGSYATLIVPENPMIQILVNGELVDGEVVLSESSLVEVKLSSVEPTISYETIVSEDELIVKIKANVVHGVSLSPKDCEPCRRLNLELEETRTYPDSASPEAITELISKYGYKGKIDYQAINRLCVPKDQQEDIVVRGITPQNGCSAKLRTSVAVRSHHDSIFRINMPPVVAIGTTVAVLEPEREGIMGKNVYGVPIPAATQEKGKTPNLGSGVMELNGDIVAIREGRPRYTKYMLDVVPELVFDQDISTKDGKVQFDGNITIHGSIREGSTVKASGMITVYGSIEKSSVFGEKGVFSHEGIYGSNVVSGEQQAQYESLRLLLEKLIHQLERFNSEFSQMVSYAIKRFDAYVTIPKIPALLFEKRHMDLEQMLGTFVDDYSELSDLDGSYRNLKELVESKWRGKNRFQVTEKDVVLLIEELVSFTESIKSLPKESPFIRTTNIASSTVRSIGNIITETSYSSTLESENTVSILRNLRGGFVVAKKSVYVGELGTPSGVETSVGVLEPNGFVNVKLNHFNTLIEVNGQRHRSYSSERDIRIGGEQS